MKELEALRGIDVYLIDQLLKNRVNLESKILDAGCGGGRNIHYLIKSGFDVTGIDAKAESVQFLQKTYRKKSEQFIHSTLENFNSSLQFDFIICNAVLHFANNHEHFTEMFASLVNHLKSNGVLFIRMTSNIGLILDQNGVFNLPDGSKRYLLTRKQVDVLLSEYSLSLLEPVKTVKVEDLRSMTTLVLKKN